MTDTRPWERGDEREPWDVDMPQGEIVELAVERAVTAWLDRNVDRLADKIAERIQPVDTLRAQVLDFIAHRGGAYVFEIEDHFLPVRGDGWGRRREPLTPPVAHFDEVIDQLQADAGESKGVVLYEEDGNGLPLFRDAGPVVDLRPARPAPGQPHVLLDGPADLDEVFIMGRSGSSGWSERVLGWTARNGKIEPLVDGGAWGIEGPTTVPHEGETDWSIYTGETP